MEPKDSQLAGLPGVLHLQASHKQNLSHHPSKVLGLGGALVGPLIGYQAASLG